jgi:glycosyltransferase involved in cell wall biosynthesis
MKERRLRILHVNKFLYRRGGAEAYMEDAAAQQQAAGHDVAFFGMDHPENTHLALARHFPRFVEMEPAPPGVAEKLRVAARTLWSRSAGQGMSAAIEEFRPDVVHFHNVYHQLSPSVVVAAQRAGVPAVMTLHDFKLACPSYLFLDSTGVCEACIGGHFSQAVRRRCKGGSLAASTLLAVESTLHHRLNAYGGVGVFICPSRFLHDKMLEAGVFPERLRVLHNFVDVPDQPTWRGEGGPVLFVGRLEHYKGVDVLVQALAHLPSDTRVDVAGDGPERASLEQLAAQVAPGRVTFHGRVAKERVAEMVAGSAVMVVPSRWYENQPLVVLEGMAAGVPVVGSDLGGITELLGPTGAGALAPPNDPAALAAALSSMLHDPRAAAHAGSRGRATVELEYSPAGHLRQLDEAYAAAGAGHRVFEGAQA